MADLLILARSGSWEGRYQATSLAATSVAVGREVHLALFFAALDAWVRGRWDALDPEAPQLRVRLEEMSFPPLSSMLAPGRESGRLRLFACSASVRMLDLEPAAVQGTVDAILGWQSFSKMTAEAAQVVAF